MHKWKTILNSGIVLFCLLLLILGAGCINNEERQPTLEETYADQLTAAQHLKENLTESIQREVGSLPLAAKNIAVDPANQSLVYQEFTNLYLQHEWLRSLVVVDEHNVITAIYPDGSTDLMTSIGDTIPVPDIISTEPRIAYYQTGNENITALITPMISDEGTYKGVIIATIDHTLFYETLVYNFQQQTDYKAWILDGDGNILYTPDRYSAETSITQLKSPEQAQLDRVVQSILANTSGLDIYTTYSYGKLKVVTEVVAWDKITVFKENKPSRIVVVTSEIDSSQQITYPRKSANMDLEEFVREACQFAQENGQEAAVAEFNNPNGRFTTAEFCIDAFSMNGTLLANSFRPGLVGTDRTNYQDLNDVYAIRMFINRAKQGGGYVTNVYQNPATGNEEVKLSYVLPIDENWLITSGKYQPEYDAYVSPERRVEMIQYVRKIEALIQEKGKQETVDLLNSGLLLREDMRMKIFDYNGTYIVSYPYPELVGTSSMGITDIYRASIGREVLTMAQSGGGFQYMYYPYLSGETKLTLTYVEPIDDEWYAMISLPLNSSEQVNKET